MALSSEQKKRKKLLRQGKDVTKNRNTSSFSLHQRKTKTKREKIDHIQRKYKDKYE